MLKLILTILSRLIEFSKSVEESSSLGYTMNSLSNSSALLRHLYDIRTPEDKEISQELEGIKEKLSKRQSVSMEFVFF